MVAFGLRFSGGFYDGNFWAIFERKDDFCGKAFNLRAVRNIYSKRKVRFAL